MKSEPAAAPPFRIGELDHVVLRVADMERALDFYCRILGCAEERRVESIGLVQLRAGRSLVDLVPAANAPAAEGGRNMDHFALTVEPFDPAALKAHFSAQGISVGDVARRYGAQGYGPSLYLNDPDGNQVELKGPAEPAA